MACIASTFTGSVAALKASKVQVSIAHEHDARRRSAEMPVCERLSFFAGRLLDTPSRGDASGGMYRATGPRESMRTSVVRSVFQSRRVASFEPPARTLFRDRSGLKISSPADREQTLTVPRLPPSSSHHQANSVSKVIKADIYPEFGTYPGGGESPIIPFGSEKNAEREVIHGRWAMLGVTGAWAAENGTGIPWFTAGTLCTPDDCTAVADKFPGAVAPLAPEGSGYPSFWAVLAIEVVLVGLAEAYRTGLSDPVFDELTVGDVSPGGRFDPLGLAESGDLEELKIKELKHCRLSMFAWLGCIMQGLATQEGPIANWQAHVADPVHANVLTNAASGFGFY